MIKAIIFDFDGLIFDTESFEYEVLKEIFEEHGSELPLSVWGKVIGTRAGFNPIAYLEEQIGKSLNKDELQLLRKERFNDKIKGKGPLPGVKEYLLAAKDLGLKVGLASSSDYKWVSDHLNNLGIFNFFECIKTADDVQDVKPDPELYLIAAESLGVQPTETIVFEDSANGALAAKRAGMYCVIVPNSVTKGLDFCEVDHRMESMAEMELKQLIKKLSS